MTHNSAVGKAALLEVARKYEKDHAWHKAIACYEQYLTAVGASDDSDIKVYVAYARNVRHTRDFIRAREIIHQAVERFPQNPELLLEDIAICNAARDWPAAQTAVERLISAAPARADSYFKLGSLLYRQGAIDLAQNAYQVGLNYQHNKPWSEIIDKICNGFSESTIDMVSEYEFVTGLTNLGVIYHRSAHVAYFTKIMRNNNAGNRREDLFYRKIVSRFDHLQRVCPAYIDSQVIDDIKYLTIQTLGPASDSVEFTEIVDILQQVSVADYDVLAADYPNQTYNYAHVRNGVAIGKFFTQIHRYDINLKLFSAIYQFTRHRNDDGAAERVISPLENLIMGNHLYAFIKPKDHYGLLHGDLKNANLGTDPTTGAIKIFDWETFKIGARVFDIAKYAVSMKIPYTRVRNEYLLAKEVSRLTPIEEIFFLYAYILLNCVMMPLEVRITEFMLPALDDLRSHVITFKQDHLGAHIHALHNDLETLRKERVRHQSRIATLQDVKKALEKDGKKLQRQLNDLKNSTSWKITNPLRSLKGLLTRKTDSSAG